MAFLDETGLAELWSIIKQTSAKVVTGTYTGTGTHGSSNPCTLTFDFAPKIVIIGERDNMAGINAPSNQAGASPILAIKPTTSMNSTGTYATKESGSPTTTGLVTHEFTWGDKSFSWYTTTSVAGAYMIGDTQKNKSGTVYSYVAIG